MKKYQIYGVGNALVDHDAQVDDARLQALNIEKNRMTLIDEPTHYRLMACLSESICHSSCGGSAANTMIALSQFGGQGFYSCKVADDEAGRLFLRELNAHGLECNLSLDNLSPGVTGQCLVLVTNDAQRTMNTHLGISESLDEKVLDFDAIKDSEYLYLEGYLITSETARVALLAARRHAQAHKTKIALTLSDPNIVRYFKNELLNLIDGQVDLIFCNEEEALVFSGVNDLEMAITRLQPLTKQLIVTCGAEGAILASDGCLISIPTREAQVVDTVGAGDLFAGAYLYAVTHGYSPQVAIELANQAATEVVGQFGARLSDERVLAIKNEFMAKNHQSEAYVIAS